MEEPTLPLLNQGQACHVPCQPLGAGLCSTAACQPASLPWPGAYGACSAQTLTLPCICLGILQLQYQHGPLPIFYFSASNVVALLRLSLETDSVAMAEQRQMSSNL